MLLFWWGIIARNQNHFCTKLQTCFFSLLLLESILTLDSMWTDSLLESPSSGHSRRYNFTTSLLASSLRPRDWCLVCVWRLRALAPVERTVFKMNLRKGVFCHKPCQTDGVAIATQWVAKCLRTPALHQVTFNNLVLIVTRKSMVLLWDVEWQRGEPFCTYLYLCTKLKSATWRGVCVYMYIYVCVLIAFVFKSRLGCQTFCLAQFNIYFCKYFRSNWFRFWF